MKKYAFPIILTLSILVVALGVANLRALRKLRALDGAAAGASKPAAAEVHQPATPPGCEVHTVKEGEDLFVIAIRWNVTIEDILEANPGIQNSSIEPGFSLFIPVDMAAFRAGKPEGWEASEIARRKAEAERREVGRTRQKAAAQEASAAIAALPLTAFSAEYEESQQIIQITLQPDDHAELEAPDTDAFWVEPDVPNLSCRINYENKILIKGDFKPETVYTVILGKGWRKKTGAMLVKDARLTVRTPRRRPSLDFVSSGKYYPARRDRLLFPFRSCGVSNLIVSVSRAYENNFHVFGMTEYRHADSGKTIAQNVRVPVAGAKSVLANHLLDLGNVITNPVPGLYHVAIHTGVMVTHGSGYWSWSSELTSSFNFMLTDLAIQFAGNPKENAGKVYAAVTSLSTGRPVAGAEVSAFTRSGQLAGKGKTGADGIARLSLDPAYSYGGHEPIALVTARTADDFSCLDFDESDAAVRGAAPKVDDPLALVFSERDICRPGEAFESAVFARTSLQQGALALTNAPVELTLCDARGRATEVRRITTDAFGFARAEWRIPAGAELGVWTVECKVGGKVAGSLGLTVASYVPDRIRVGIVPSYREAVGFAALLGVRGRADYYFDEPLAGGTYSLYAWLLAAKAPRHWKGWRVGDEAPVESVDAKFTGEVIDGVFSVDVDPTRFKADKVFRPFKLALAASVQEPGGRAVSAYDSVVLYPTPWFIGVREGAATGSVETVAYDFAFLPAQVGAFPKGCPSRIKVALSREEWRRHFEDRGDGNLRAEWRSEKVPLPSLTRYLDVPDGGAASWTGRVAYAASELPSGRYILEATADDLRTTFDFWHWAGDTDTRSSNPAAFSVETGAPNYRPGEKATLTFRSPAAGTVFVVAGWDGVNACFSQAVTQGVNSVAVDLPAGLLASCYYAGITLVTEGLPAAPRLHALAKIKVDTSNTRKLTVGLSIPEKVRPGETVDVAVTLADADGTPRAGLVRVGALDEGVASLTNFHVPDAFRYFFGRDLGAPFSCFDYFNMMYPEVRLLPDGTFGGDDNVQFSMAARNRRDGDARQVETARLALPPIVVSTNGRAVVKARLPDHLGAMRFMAVAGSAEAVGSAEDTVVMRDTISVVPTAPRFAAGGDRFDLTAVVFNHEAEEGDWRLEVSLPDGLSVGGSNVVVRTGRLAKGKSGVVTVPVSIADDAQGAGKIAFALSLGDDKASARTYITVRPLHPVESRVAYLAVTNGVLELPAVAADWIGQAESSLTIFGSPAYGVAESLSWLADYPYGCLEQTTSAAFPFVAADDLSKIGMLPDGGRDHAAARIKLAYSEILQMGIGDGSFGMWPWAGKPWTYGSLFANHFLFEAEKAGYLSFDDGFRRQQIRWLRSVIANASPANRGNAAYATYILAVAGDIAFVNSARNIVSADKPDFASFLAAAAMLRGGFAGEGAEPFRKALSARVWENDDDWDRVKNLGMALFVAARTGTDDLGALLPIAARLNAFLRDDGSAWGTTRDNSWAALGLAALAARMESGKSFGKAWIGERAIDFEVSEKTAAIPRGEEEAVKIVAEGPVFVKALTVGVPRKPAVRNGGIAISRRYVDGKGKPVSKVRKGELVTAVIEISPVKAIENAVLADLVPGGFELEDSTLATRSTAEAYHPQKVTRPDGKSEIRDDRWLWFGKLRESSKEVPQTLTYTLRAVVPGTYAIPSATVEDMYDPSCCGGVPGEGTVTIE